MNNPGCVDFLILLWLEPVNVYPSFSGIFKVYAFHKKPNTD